MLLTIHLLGSHATSSGTWVPTFCRPYNPAKCQLTYSSVNATLHPPFVISLLLLFTQDIVRDIFHKTITAFSFMDHKQ